LVSAGEGAGGALEGDSEVVEEEGALESEVDGADCMAGGGVVCGSVEEETSW
jgi:hypothetical protein